jgi:hypothetical protein
MIKVIKLYRVKITVWTWKNETRPGTKAKNGIGLIVEIV